MGTVHVVPVDDLVTHEVGTVDADCICGPDIEYLIVQDGRSGRLITHHALDGRELLEQE
jgi:hypothetical protein